MDEPGLALLLVGGVLFLAGLLGWVMMRIGGKR